MKFQPLIVAAVVMAIGACKTPYKATDNPKPATDTTATKRPLSTDSTGMRRIDSVKMDSTIQPLPDSAKISTGIDSVRVQPGIDSAVNNAGLDSTRTQPVTNSVKTATAIDSSAKSTEAPAAVEAVFSKQYPGATNVVWSTYDSLAAVPIDMRLTGWKKLDAEDYMVKFDLKNESYYAWYDSNGKWIGSASPMKDFTKLPPAVNTAVNNAIKTRYTEYNLSQVNREFQTGKKSYEVELTKGDDKVRMLVSSAGKITQIFKYAATKQNK